MVVKREVGQTRRRWDKATIAFTIRHLFLLPPRLKRYLGTRDVFAFSPSREAYIDASDFDRDPVRLAAHLLQLAANETAYRRHLAWRSNQSSWSDHFVALFDLNAVHSSCRLCIHLADRMTQNQTLPPMRNASVPSSKQLFVYARERGTFYFRPVLASGDTLAALSSAIHAAFAGRQPTWMRYKARAAMAKALGGPRLWRIYPAYASVWDSMHGPAIDTDTKAREALTKHHRLELIWL